MTKTSPGDQEERLQTSVGGFLFWKRPTIRHRAARLGALVVALAVLGFIPGPPLMARKKKPPTTKTVRGQVLNSSNNGIAGATVNMTDLTTGTKSGIYAGTGGRYVFSGLKPTHDYQFLATYKGKSSEARKVSSWDTRMRLVINLHIPPPKEE